MEWSTLGHERIKKYFECVLKKDAFSHAYLMSGADGIGKRRLALEVIRAAHPTYQVGVNDPYAMVIEPGEKATIGIEEHIRPLAQALSLSPPPGVRVFVLIDDAELMSLPAQQAVLKILEEPPSYVTFLLTSSSPGRLPGTVRSRCLELRCASPSVQDVRAYLRKQKVAEKYHKILERMAGGGIGWLHEVIQSGDIAREVSEVQDLEEQMTRGKTERLIWAATLAKNDNLRPKVLRWMTYVRDRIAEDPMYAKTARGLMELHDSLSFSGSNARLHVEHFVLNMQ